jgi:hypothetical protein
MGQQDGYVLKRIIHAKHTKLLIWAWRGLDAQINDLADARTGLDFIESPQRTRGEGPLDYFRLKI